MSTVITKDTTKNEITRYNSCSGVFTFTLHLRAPLFIFVCLF